MIDGLLGLLSLMKLVGYGPEAPLPRFHSVHQKPLVFSSLQQACPLEWINKKTAALIHSQRGKKDWWVSWMRWNDCVLAHSHITHYSVIKEMKFLYGGGSTASFIPSINSHKEIQSKLNFFFVSLIAEFMKQLME